MYATGDDFISRYDVRLVGDLVSDTGTAVPAANVPGHAILLAALTDASSAIDAALFVGNRYTPAQLAGLSDTAASFLRRLCCDVTLIYLKRRRGRFDSEKDAALLKEINQVLDDLRSGKDLLLLNSQTQAGASTVELAGPAPGPQVIPIVRPNTIRRHVYNYFPVQSDARPRGDR